MSDTYISIVFDLLKPMQPLVLPLRGPSFSATYHTSTEMVMEVEIWHFSFFRLKCSLKKYLSIGETLSRSDRYK